jgi:50S ribosomal protein L16 3-hydroxylase
MTKDFFLKHYWNKKPCLFKQALPEIKDFGTIKDFLEMALEDDHETRMVIETGGDYPWQAKEGPFKKSDFNQKTLWTLICHNLEIVNEDFQQLKKRINFLPQWNFDDIMATVSKKGASVGAHIDDYSVFIIQGKGKRRWLLEENPKRGYLPDLDIRLLKQFDPEIEWILEPGDMIYIPPNVAHHGISLEDSISYSLGLKSVRYNELIVNFAMDLMTELKKESYSVDRKAVSADPFLISKKVRDDIFQDITTLFSDRKKFEYSLQKFLTRPKNESYPDEELSDKEILKILKKTWLKRDAWARLASMKMSKGYYRISINQNMFLLKTVEYKIICDYFERSPLKPFKIRPEHLKIMALQEIFIKGFSMGLFYREIE